MATSTPGAPGVEGERARAECLCCCEQCYVDMMRVCAKSHHVCSACQRKTRLQACIYCMPFPNVHQDTHIQPSSTTETTRENEGESCGPCVCDVVVCLWRMVSCFFILVYAGKIFVWLYTVTQDREVGWLSWDSFWHAPRELMIGFFGLMVLAGCCVRNP